MLLIVRLGAVAGVLFRVFRARPRWLYTPIYVALGWVAVFYLGPLLQHGGPAIVALIAVGGLLYTLGAVVYGIAPESLASLVRLPRGLPHPHRGRLRRPLRGGVDERLQRRRLS